MTKAAREVLEEIAERDGTYEDYETALLSDEANSYEKNDEDGNYFEEEVDDIIENEYGETAYDLISKLKENSRKSEEEGEED